MNRFQGNIHLQEIESASLCGLCWNSRTIYNGLEPKRNVVVVPALQGILAGDELILWNRFLGS
jgi:hypothetical protein